MVTQERLKVGTRASRLAIAQTMGVVKKLRSLFPDAEIKIQKISTAGDRDPRTPLEEFTDPGVFVKEIEAQLIAGRIDLAVHSMKDLPAEMHERLTVASVPVRDDPRDALVSRDNRRLAQLRAGDVVGTSSLRRRLQVLRLRPDLKVEEIRGNLDTRLRKLDAGGYDAIVVAAAGLARTGLLRRASELFDVDDFLPAAGQGALAIQTRREDLRVRRIVRHVNDMYSEAAVNAERAFLRRLDMGCQAAAGVYAKTAPDILAIAACLWRPDDGHYRRGTIEGSILKAEELGVRLAEKLSADGT